MFTKISTVEKLALSNSDKKVVVSFDKYVKNGTKREFFTPVVDGRRLTKTMYCRLWEAKNFVKANKTQIISL